MNRLMLRRKRILIQKRKKQIQQKRKRALIQKRKKQLQIKNKKNNNKSLINTLEENIIINNNNDNNYKNDNIKKIDAIFVQSFYKEILTNQLQNFIKNRLINNINCDIPIYVFLDIKSENFSNRLNHHNNRINYIYINEKSKNGISYIFYKMMNFKTDEYSKVLLLETDCKLLYDFVKKINTDIISKDNIWIYGSYYYGKRNISNRKHMNGVAIYNRNNNFLKFVKKVFINQNFINKSNNYDSILSKKISNYDKNLLYNSNYILNICTPDDIKLNYKKFKKNAVIIHQKDNNKYNRHTFKKLNMNQLLKIK